MPDSTQLKSKTFSAFRWNLWGQVLMYVTALAGTILLSRLLGPTAFGLMGMLTVFTGLANLVVQASVSTAVVQHQNLDQRDLSSFCWLNIGMGVVLALAFFFGAHQIALFYKQPELEDIAQWMGITFLFVGFSGVPVGILSKQMDFKSLTIAQLLGSVTSYGIAIVLALQGFGYWSLVAQFVTNQLVYMVMIAAFCKWWPSATFSVDSLRKIARFSRNLLPSHIIDFIVVNGDILLIGKIFGARDTGHYSRAGALVMLPVYSLGVTFNKIFYPVFSNLQNDVARLKRAFLRSYRILTAALMPVFILVAIEAHDVSVFLFGPEWAEISGIVSVLSLFSAITVLNNFGDSMLISQGKTDVLLRFNVAEKVLLGVGVVTGMSLYGIIGIAWAKAISTALTFIPKLIVVSRIVKTSPGEILRTLGVVLLSLVVCAITGILLSEACAGFALLARLVCVTGGSLVAMLLVLVVTRDSVIADIIEFLKAREGK